MKSAFFTWGGWDGHEPEETTALFARTLRGYDYSVVVHQSLDYLSDSNFLKQFDLIVPVWTMASISPEQIRGLRAAVESGVGLAGWHGGMGDSFRDCVDYQFMVGGQWVAHPGNCIEYTVEVISNDKIVADLPKRFSMHSEQYYMHVDPNNEVLAVTTFSGDHLPWIAGNTIPVAWKREWGAGRVFYCSLGHVASDFEVPAAREMVVRGMLWASR